MHTQRTGDMKQRKQSETKGVEGYLVQGVLTACVEEGDTRSDGHHSASSKQRASSGISTSASTHP